MTTKQQKLDLLQVVGLIVVAGALVFLGVISVVNRVGWQEPTDGVVWEPRDGALVAVEVAPDGPGARAGVETGDVLSRIGRVPIEPADPALVRAILWDRQPGTQVDYELRRPVSGDAPGAVEAGRLREHTVAVMVGSVRPENRPYYYLLVVGAAFLIAGIFALLRGTDRKANARFFVLAAAFYAVLVLSPTREGDPLFQTIFWLEEVARALLPGLIIYFALTFPRPKPAYERHRAKWLAGAFGPGLAHFLVNATIVVSQGRAVGGASAAYSVLEVGQRFQIFYLAAALAVSIVLFAHSYRDAETLLERKRLKWLAGGAAVGVVPFMAIYAPIYALGIEASHMVDLAVLPLLLVPLACAYAVVGFRVWDVEVILKRGATYALASLMILGIYLAGAALFRWILGDEALVRAAAMLATLLAAFFFAPLRDRVQEWIDRLYYRERYRARRTLMDFGRELNSEIDLAQIVHLLSQRVRETLGVTRVAVMLRDDDGEHLLLLPPDGDVTEGKSLSTTLSSFLCGALSKREFLYIDDLESLLEEFPADRETLEAEDLSYFLPLIVKNDVVGVLALGRTLSGDYLSSDDLHMLQPLTSHAALAIENALLYREAERRARELERLKVFNENIVESINVGVMVLDHDGRVLSWNRALEQDLDIPGQEAEGSPISELFPRSFLTALDRARTRVEEGHDPLASAYRVPLRTRDGRDRVLNLSVAPLLGEEGAHGTVIILDDVTERTELESQLRQSEKLASVGLLAAGVAHEVNTPLTGISSYVQMLQRKLPDNDPRRPILEKIEKQSFRASQIVNNLLNFSRQETGEMRPIGINEVVEETLSLADVQLSKRGIEVTARCADSLDRVHGDPVRIQQVLMNLLLNARDAMPEGGELEVSTQQRDGQVIIEVSDTGEGISPEDVHRIYDPFFTTKGPGHGTGLGLSVSYGIIQEHRGTITVDSEPGEGTTFRIALPSLEASRQRAAS